MHEHIGILQTRKPVDRRAVKADAFFKRDFDIGRRNGDIFRLPKISVNHNRKKRMLRSSICLMTYCFVSIMKAPDGRFEQSPLAAKSGPQLSGIIASWVFMRLLKECYEENSNL